jgi:catechol 2,3-dioxygenase-like lactoylglutathione lyase family enzyme
MVCGEIDRALDQVREPDSLSVPMLDQSSIIAFVATTDGARARAFYENTLGLRVISDDDYAIACDANGTMVRIQKVQTLSAQPFTALGWAVSDIEAAVRSLVARGVVFERYEFLKPDAHGVWTSPSGAKVAWFKDPDGNTLSITQLT